jgi:hypothetical protein
MPGLSHASESAQEKAVKWIPKTVMAQSLNRERNMFEESRFELTLRPAFPPYPAEAWVNTRRQSLVVSDPLEETGQLFALFFAERR